MKKLFTILLAVLLLTACSSNSDPKVEQKSAKELYTAAMEKLNNEDKVEMNMISKIDMNAAGEEMSIDLNMNMKMDQIDKTNPAIAMTANMNAAGEAVDMAMYFKDGILYMDLLGSKVGVKMPYDEALDQIENMGGEVQEFDDEELANATVTEENGNYVLTFSMDEETLNELTEEVLNEVGASGVEGAAITYGNTYSKVTITKDGKLLSSDVILEMTVAVGEEAIEMNMTATVEYVGYGNAVDMNMPDFSTYTIIEE